MTRTAGSGDASMTTDAPGPTLAEALSARLPEEVQDVLLRFADAAADVRDRLAVAPLTGALGHTGATNAQQESTAKLDDIANEVFKEALSSAPAVARLISEEEETPVVLREHGLTCAYDPLDGSSNIGVAPVGSVMGVYDAPGGAPSEEAPLLGRHLLASAFAVYGLPSVLVVATAEGVDGFAFDPQERTWRLAFPAIRIPEAKYVSINWMYRARWSPSVAAGVDAASQGLGGRYSGSMVEDVLRVLLSGGVFLYPEDANAPQGKLRMLYEVCPIGLMVEAAGGAALDGARRVLDVPVTTPHQRGPMVVGAADAVDRYHQAYTTQASTTR